MSNKQEVRGKWRKKRAVASFCLSLPELLLRVAKLDLTPPSRLQKCRRNTFKSLTLSKIQ